MILPGFLQQKPEQQPLRGSRQGKIVRKSSDLPSKFDRFLLESQPAGKDLEQWRWLGVKEDRYLH